MGLNTDIRNISNTLQKNTQKTEKKAIKELENKYNILDILKNEMEAAVFSELDIFNKIDREIIENRSTCKPSTWRILQKQKYNKILYT